MTGTDVPYGDMPNIPQSPLQDGSAVTDTDLAALLAGKRDVGAALQPVADVLAALSAEPSLGELAGEASARAQRCAPVTASCLLVVFTCPPVFAL